MLFYPQTEIFALYQFTAFASIDQNIHDSQDWTKTPSPPEPTGFVAAEYSVLA